MAKLHKNNAVKPNTIYWRDQGDHFPSFTEFPKLSNPLFAIAALHVCQFYKIYKALTCCQTNKLLLSPDNTAYRHNVLYNPVYIIKKYVQFFILKIGELIYMLVCKSAIN